MTVRELANIEGFSSAVISDETREINGVYIGDLLSWVMGRASQDNAWITIMSNINILAVASLADTSCIIIAEGVKLEEEVIETAKQKNINIIYSQSSIYETAVCLSQII